MPVNYNRELVRQLTCEDKTILLIGTAHVSRESADLVKAVIEEEKPDTVCVELCPSRYQAVRQKDRWQGMDIIKVIREKKAFLLLANLILASFQKRIADKLDVQPGQEMIQAVEAAEAAGAEICLADRDIRVTLSRTLRKMSLWAKMKLLFHILLSLNEVDEIDEAAIEELKKQDMLDAVLSEVGRSMPVVREILIDERDQYLSWKIRNAAGRKIVAVVGAGHVPGIQQYWQKDIAIEDLETMPSKSGLTRSIKWILPIFIAGLIVSGFFWGGAKTGSDMLAWWVLANGVLAGIGALAALAHPLTILSSVVAAPLTSLNPMIAAGWVSGLVEAFARKPKVLDFEHLPIDITSIRGFWRNKITRILLVVVFTNLGSSIGTFVAIPMMFKAM